MALSIFALSDAGCSGTTIPDAPSAIPTESCAESWSTTALAAPRITWSAVGLSIVSRTSTTATGGRLSCWGIWAGTGRGGARIASRAHGAVPAEGGETDAQVPAPRLQRRPLGA